jgi:hypothetical protein
MKAGIVKNLVQRADDAKKVNKLDLSADQDLTVALMNLIHVENISCNFPDLQTMVADVRAQLLGRIVKKTDKKWELSVLLLGKSMQLIEDAMCAQKKNKTADAYALFDSAYEVYSLFWGINMDLISPLDINLDE